MQAILDATVSQAEPIQELLVTHGKVGPGPGQDFRLPTVPLGDTRPVLPSGPGYLSFLSGKEKYICLFYFEVRCRPVAQMAMSSLPSCFCPPSAGAAGVPHSTWLHFLL